jgi:hypothetical protein
MPVGCRDDTEDSSVIEQVFEHLSRKNLRLNASKCSFMQKKIRLLWTNLNEARTTQSPDTIAATVHAPAPTNV